MWVNADVFEVMPFPPKMAFPTTILGIINEKSGKSIVSHQKNKVYSNRYKLSLESVKTRIKRSVLYCRIAFFQFNNEFNYSNFKKHTSKLCYFIGFYLLLFFFRVKVNNIVGTSIVCSILEKQMSKDTTF